jgi:hypothetical protein
MWNIILLAFLVLVIVGSLILSLGWTIPVVIVLLLLAFVFIPPLFIATTGEGGPEELRMHGKPSWLRKHWWE